MRHLVLLFITFATPALAQQRAEFIDGTYVFSPGACDKLHALAAGGVQAITTVPWHVIAACEENGDESAGMQKSNTRITSSS
jgi:hypothetical protein